MYSNAVAGSSKHLSWPIELVINRGELDTELDILGAT